MEKLVNDTRNTRDMDDDDLVSAGTEQTGLQPPNNFF